MRKAPVGTTRQSSRQTVAFHYASIHFTEKFALQIHLRGKVVELLVK